MPDPFEPVDPVASPRTTPLPEEGDPAHPTSTGLPSNVAAALACFPLIGGIIFYILEKRDSFVRFYAMQSIIFGLAWILFGLAWRIFYSILASIPAIGVIFAFLLWLIWAVVNVAFLIVLIIAIVKAFSGVRWDIPVGGTDGAQADRHEFLAALSCAQRTARWLQEKLHHHLVQDQFVIELSADDLQVRLEAGFKAMNELIGGETSGVHRGQAERVAIDRAIFFPRQMGRGLVRQAVQGRDEGEWRARSRQPVALHQVLREQKISHRRDDGDEQNSDHRFALVEQPPNECERALQIARGEGVPELEDDTGARDRHQSSHFFERDPAARRAEVEINLLQLVSDHARVATGQENEEIERVRDRIAAGVFCLTTARDRSLLPPSRCGWNRACRRPRARRASRGFCRRNGACPRPAR